MNADLISDYKEKRKWLGKKESYNYIFLYGNYNSLISRSDFDIHFKIFDSLKEFLEIFYYLFNGVDVCSIDIDDILNILGSRPYDLKIYSFNSIEEILKFLEHYTGQINDMFYFEKSTYNDFNISKFAEDIEKIKNTIKKKTAGNIFFPYTSVVVEENGELWKKLLVI
ncbi:hypothetical protein [Caldicellulosiruptor owensensis]|uniref:hypothetical protein n=1 Tax=Caldicellulosiruptor owensensis TaxID=55205 RepID=UPI0011D12FB6|nr:hypothetical protein [Caldicellulosiruptor owensensis]